MPTVPQDIAAGFFLLPLTVLAVLAVLLIRCSRQLRWVVTIMVAWTALTAVLAASGTLADFGTGHPRIPILVLTQLVFVVWLAWFSRWSGDLAQMPQLYLVGLQCFRIPVELMMAELAARNLLAVEMTFHGRNFDILTGVTAVILVVWIRQEGEVALRHVLVGWNLMGLSFVTAVLAHGLLSVPYPFQLLHLSVPTFVIASFPVVWLATVLVPVAYLLHFVSLKRCLAERPGTSEGVSG